MDSKEDFNEDPSYEDQEKSPKLSGSYASLSSDTLSASFHESETSRSSRFLKDTEDLPEHPDEHQVQLDTDRSFVLYPVGVFSWTVDFQDIFNYNNRGALYGS